MGKNKVTIQVRHDPWGSCIVLLDKLLEPIRGEVHFGTRDVVSDQSHGCAKGCAITEPLQQLLPADVVTHAVQDTGEESGGAAWTPSPPATCRLEVPPGDSVRLEFAVELR